MTKEKKLHKMSMGDRMFYIINGFLLFLLALIILYRIREGRHIVRIQRLQPGLIVLSTVHVEREIYIGNRRVLTFGISAGNVLGSRHEDHIKIRFLIIAAARI